MPLPTHWLKRLYHHYTAPMEQVFKRFKLGASLFFVGLVIIYIAHQSMVDSLQQELVMLLGVALIGIGFFIAMLAQMRMLIGRVISFFKK